MKRRSGICRTLITVFMAALLTMESGLVCVEAYTAGGLDEYVSLDLVGGGASQESAEPAEEEAAEPLLEPGAKSFAEALAQEYQPEEGKYILSGSSRFYIASEEAPADQLVETVKLASVQFAAYGLPSEQPLPIVYGPREQAAEGDIIITLSDKDDFLYGIKTADLNETYRIDVYDKAEIEACDTDGIWYGLIELLEIASEKRSEAGKSIVMDRFRLRDGPDLRERALMLDCGRKFYSKEWIKNLIRRASLQRYNAIVLHFAEAEGIRLDSQVFPWLTEGIDSLTPEDMKEIVETAHQYHMEVIPSFDTPGHNTFMVERYAAYVKEHPDFSFVYGDRTYDSSIKGFGSIANYYSNGGETEKADYIGIDLTSEHAVAFSNALIDGYADFFADLGCNKFDIGSDELLGWYTLELGGELIEYENRWSALEHWEKYARETLGIEKGSASDVLITYINDVAGRLESKGYTCRVFNDDIDINKNQHVELRESVEVTYWFDGDNSARHFAEKGHVMHNFMESWCFYVLRSSNGRDIMRSKYKSVNARNIFTNWNPRSFARKAGRDMSVPEDKFGGGYFAIWCDFPDYKDAGTVWKETEFRTWANASRMWNAEVNSQDSGIRGSMPYEGMRDFAASLNGFPGYTGDPEVTASLPDAPAVSETDISLWQRLTDEAEE